MLVSCLPPCRSVGSGAEAARTSGERVLWSLGIAFTRERREHHPARRPARRLLRHFSREVAEYI